MLSVPQLQQVVFSYSRLNSRKSVMLLMSGTACRTTQWAPGPVKSVSDGLGLQLLCIKWSSL